MLKNRMFKKIKISLFFAVILCQFWFVSCSRSQRVVILPFENLSQYAKDDWLRDAYSESLTDHLQYAEEFDIVHRAEIEQACNEIDVKPYVKI